MSKGFSCSAGDVIIHNPHLDATQRSEPFTSRTPTYPIRGMPFDRAQDRAHHEQLKPIFKVMTYKGGSRTAPTFHGKGEVNQNENRHRDDDVEVAI